MLTIEEGRPGDLGDTVSLLHRVGLSGQGLTDGMDQFLIARENGELVAVAALEPHDRAGLLRSVAVTPARQRWGLARYLINALIARARERRLSAIYLLTRDAQRYFKRYGFKPINRAEVSPAVAESAQFKEESCATATAMMLDLT